MYALILSPVLIFFFSFFFFLESGEGWGEGGKRERKISRFVCLQFTIKNKKKKSFRLVFYEEEEEEQAEK